MDISIRKVMTKYANIFCVTQRKYINANIFLLPNIWSSKQITFNEIYANIIKNKKVFWIENEKSI